MSVAEICVPGTLMVAPSSLPTPQHLTWNQTQIYQSASFPPVAGAGPPQVNPITINLPADIQTNELIGITVVAYRGSGGTWNPTTDTIQWSCNEFDGTGVFGYELGSGCITNIPAPNAWLQAEYDASSICSQQNWFYFEATPYPVEFRQFVLWATGTPTAGSGGGVEVWLFRQQ